MSEQRKCSKKEIDQHIRRVNISAIAATVLLAIGTVWVWAKIFLITR